MDAYRYTEDRISRFGIAFDHLLRGEREHAMIDFRAESWRGCRVEQERSRRKAGVAGGIVIYSDE